MDNLSALVVAVALMCIMFGMGLSLTINDFKRIVREPQGSIDWAGKSAPAFAVDRFCAGINTRFKPGSLYRHY